MMLFWLTLVSWVVVFLRYDKPSVPAWVTRNAWRWWSMLVLIALLKAAFWNIELRAMIAGCH